jgi:hypothetical protein
MRIEDLPSTPFTTAMAHGWGFNHRRLRSAVRSRLLVRILRGVYLRAEVPVTTHTKLTAAALVIRPGSVACDRTAAWIWEVDVHEFRELDQVPPIETCVLPGQDPTDRADVHGLTRDLRPCDWVEVNGVRVTTPLRTALDLGCLLNRRPALAAMDALMRAHGFSTQDMQAMLPWYFRRRGVVQLRELVPLVDPRAESHPESWTRLTILDQGLPAPHPQWWVIVNGVPTYRIDLAYPHARIAIEYNGEEFHTSEGDREADRRRTDWLVAHGWTVIVVDKSSFSAEAIQAWIGEIREALLEAQRRPLRVYAAW